MRGAQAIHDCSVKKWLILVDQRGGQPSNIMINHLAVLGCAWLYLAVKLDVPIL